MISRGKGAPGAANEMSRHRLQSCSCCLPAENSPCKYLSCLHGEFASCAVSQGMRTLLCAQCRRDACDGLTQKTLSAGLQWLSVFSEQLTFADRALCFPDSSPLSVLDASVRGVSLVVFLSGLLQRSHPSCCAPL